MTRPGPIAAALVLAALVGCAAGVGGAPSAIDSDPVLTALAPASLVPGSRLVLTGTGFAPADVGATDLVLEGTVGGQAVRLSLPARFVDSARLEVAFPGGRAAGLGADAGTFVGQARLLITAGGEGGSRSSPPLPVVLALHGPLTPRLDAVATGVIYVNDDIALEGDGFLLGGDEGATVAVVAGCWRAAGAASCTPVGPVEVTARPETPTSRQHALFPFDPHIAGIAPGTLEDATVAVRNRHGAAAGGAVMDGDALPASYALQPPAVWSMSPTAASLGQIVAITGGGFVGDPAGSPDPTLAVTTFRLAGSVTPADGAATSVALDLVGGFVSGRLVSYVPSEGDDLGRVVDLRTTTGTFSGTIRPTVRFAQQTVTGAETSVALDLARLRQIVWVSFLPSYVESLRHFGLRAVDGALRERVLAVAARDYAGVNVEFRTSEPTDFALYARVDISGPDPNGLGLLGYDNTPGKDVGDERLDDVIGGANALTEQDGAPGYGGVFLESFFGFSEHPGAFAARLDGASRDFDRVFDPFRPDRGGLPVTAADLAGGAVTTPASGAGCPAADGERADAIRCAVWVLGSMIGTTMTHEVGHSLGLADPYGPLLHDPGDEPDRLMDAGDARTFNERAEIRGEGPGVFCDAEYDYLRQILPSASPPPLLARPPCT